MRILVVGASGTIGRAVVAALQDQHEVVPVSLRSTPITVDIVSPEAIERMYKRVGKIAAVVCTAGLAKFAPFDKLGEADYQFSLANKLMGQVNLVRLGFPWVLDGGSFTLTSGVLAQAPAAGGAAYSLVNAGLEGFARAAALEAPRGIRVNVVSPPWVAETLRALGMDPSGGLPSATVARAYVTAITGAMTGAVLEPGA